MFSYSSEKQRNLELGFPATLGLEPQVEVALV